MAQFNKQTQEQFIAKAIAKHDNIYDYSLVQYVRSCDKVKIICKEHGIFHQSPNSHLAGHGCRKCQYASIAEKQKHSKETFIEKCKEKHGNDYDYNSVEYINNHTKIKIFCRKCGKFFMQNAGAHSSGHGCEKCGGSEKLTTESFIQRARKVHGDKYDYSLVNYVENKIKIKIICKKHNSIFEQQAVPHLQGSGCPICCFSHGERIIYNWLENHNIPFKHGHRFKDCCNKKPLPFDFYLPDYNICIEFDGEQHYRQTTKFKSLESVQFRDSIKNAYCLKNNITLIRIPYFKIKEIPAILAAVFPETNRGEAFPPKP